MKAEEILSANSDKGHYDWDAMILSMKEYARIQIEKDRESRLPTKEEVKSIIEKDLPNSEEYQKYSKDTQSLLMAATKAGAFWFRESLIDGSFTDNNTPINLD